MTLYAPLDVAALGCRHAAGGTATVNGVKTADAAAVAAVAAADATVGNARRCGASSDGSFNFVVGAFFVRAGS